MTVPATRTPENDRRFHASSHDTGESLFLAVVEHRAQRWLSNPAKHAQNWLTSTGAGWTSVKRFGHPSSRDFTYFIRFEIPQGERPIKIGIAGKPIDRLHSLRCGSPYPMTLLAVYPDELLPEVLMHEVFAESRLCGEWFSPTPLLLSLVDTVCNCHPLTHAWLRRPAKVPRSHRVGASNQVSAK